MQIRSLHPIADRPQVAALLDAAADYIRMERGEDPDDTVIEEFFTDGPPGCDANASLRLGLFEQGNLIGIAELAFGFPEPNDAYLGLMIIAAAARGKGAGQFLLRHLERAARAKGAKAMYLAVLEANPRGRAFWEREGFTLALANREVTLGQKTQIVHRLGKPLAG